VLSLIFELFILSCTQDTDLGVCGTLDLDYFENCNITERQKALLRFSKTVLLQCSWITIGKLEYLIQFFFYSCLAKYRS